MLLDALRSTHQISPEVYLEEKIHLVLAFVVTQQLIDQLKQLITQLTHLTRFLGLKWLLILG